MCVPAELRKDGVKVRLQEQPFRILAMLLERPGEVVLRDDLRRRLWPNDTVVEVGHGINAAVLRLREALGESAENPRFVETLARRGYRFTGTGGGGSQGSGGARCHADRVPWTRQISTAKPSPTSACWNSSEAAEWAWSIAPKISSWAARWR